MSPKPCPIFIDTQKGDHDQHIKYQKQQNTKKLSWSTTCHINIHVKCKMSPSFYPRMRQRVVQNKQSI